MSDRPTRYEDLPLTLTPMEAAKALGFGRNSIYEALRTGDLPSVRIGRRIVIPKAALQARLEGAGTRD